MMASIGNDLVARQGLKLFDRKGYLQKAFTATEISGSPIEDPLLYFGMLWASKESAYKVNIKKGFRKAFSPLKYCAEISPGPTSETYRGQVRYGSSVFYTTVSIAEEFIYAVSSEDLKAIELTYNQVIEIPNADPVLQSNAALTLLQQILRTRMGFSSDEMATKLSAMKMYPSMIDSQGERPFDLSISHDGIFVAVACLDPKNDNLCSR